MADDEKEVGGAIAGGEGAGGLDRRRVAVRLGWVLGLVLLDLVTKAVVFAWIGDLDAAGELVRDHDGHRRFPLLGTEWLAFMLSTNPGAAFGQLGDIPHFLVALRIVCVFLLGTWLVAMEGGGRGPGAGAGGRPGQAGRGRRGATAAQRRPAAGGGAALHRHRFPGLPGCRCP